MSHDPTLSRRQFLMATAGALAFGQLPSLLLRAQSVTPAKTLSTVADFIHQEIVSGSFPGAGLLVYRNGQPVCEYFEGSYCSCTTRANPVLKNTTHLLHSFSKGVSATVIAIARQKNLIDYDASLSRYIPGYRGEWKDETTIRHLLTHTAGIPNCVLKSVYTDDTWNAAVETCCAAKVEWRPGSRSEYHARSGMLLAAEAVRSQLPGRPSWEEICRDWLLDPIGATTLTFKIPTSGDIALTPQPKELPNPITPETSTKVGHPGAGSFGQLTDIIKVLQLHLNAGVWEGKTILAREQWAEMHRIQYRSQILQAENEKRTPDYEPFGLGWKIKLHQPDDGFGLGSLTPEGTFGHAGVWTLMGIGIPEKQLCFAFASTHPPTQSNLARIRNGITDRIYNDFAR